MNPPLHKTINKKISPYPPEPSFHGAAMRPCNTSRKKNQKSPIQLPTIKKNHKNQIKNQIKNKNQSKN